MGRDALAKAISTKALKRVDRCTTSGDWLRRLREARLDGSEKKFVRQQWVLVFKDRPIDGIGQVMMETVLGYQITYDEKVASSAPMTALFKRNYEAAMAMDVKRFSPSMRYLIALDIKHRGLTPEKETEMKMKRKAGAEKAQKTKELKEGKKGPKKGATWHALFTANFKAKLTDALLAKAMTAKMGDGHTYTEAEVIKNRGFFNFGAFGAKYAKPEKALEQFKSGK